MKTTYLSSEQKNFPSSTGVYSISFKNSKKIYVGSASKTSGEIKSGKGFYSRWRKHIALLKSKKHYSTKLQNAFNKYGEQNMAFSILVLCEPENCIIKEQEYIDKYDSYNKGYNLRPKANNNLGFKQTENFFITQYDKYKKIRDSYYEDIKQLYDQNKTTREISAILKISRGVIRKVFKENNIQGKNIVFYKKKKIYQYNTTTGELIKEWQGFHECSVELKIHTNSIRQVINGLCKHAKGFYFNLEKLNRQEVLNNIKKLVNNPKNRKYTNIKQLDKDKKLLRVWKDIKEVVDFYEFKNSQGIYRAILNQNYNKNGYYKGFFWIL
jgi:group I intron endonuclease